MPLTTKQQRFVEEYLIDGNATQAAIRAGYAKSGARTEGARLLANADIAAAVAAKQERRSERLQITADKVLADIEEVRRRATHDGEYAPALRASELQGKHIGMWNGAATIDPDGEQALDKLTVAQRLAFLLTMGVQQVEEKKPDLH